MKLVKNSKIGFPSKDNNGTHYAVLPLCLKNKVSFSFISLALLCGNIATIIHHRRRRRRTRNVVLISNANECCSLKTRFNFRRLPHWDIIDLISSFNFISLTLPAGD
jgi:hypothetical protein